MVIIGVDPGLTGGLAILCRDKLINVLDMPSMRVGKGKSARRDFDIPAIDELLFEWWASCEAILALEWVHAMPKNGSLANFSMGRARMLFEALAAHYKVRLEPISPQAWKRAMGIPAGSSKNQSIIRAKQLFLDVRLDRKCDHGKAEAILIAEAVRRRLGG